MGKRWGNSVNDKFYQSARWKKCRSAYLAEHPYCERCAVLGKVSLAENVHHIKHLDARNVNDPNVALNFDNLEALCHACHYAEHYGRHETADGYLFDENGDLIHIPPVDE